MPGSFIRSSFKVVVGMLLAFCFVLNQPLSASAESNYPAWVKVGGKVGNHDRYLGLTDVFVPLTQSPGDLLFTDLRVKEASGPEVEYNIGFGYRHMMDETWILGVYGYCDKLRSAHQNYFNQGTLGIEALTKDWDFRMNAYFPETKKEMLFSSSTGRIDISGTSITASSINNETREQALPGFDAEVGYKLPLAEDIRVYAGGFYFHRSGAPIISGPRARTEWRWEDFLGFEGTRLTIEGEYSHDQVRNSEVYAGASVRIPFGLGAAKSGKQGSGSLESRMVEPIVRDVDVVSGEAKTTTTTSGLDAINPNTGVAYSGIYYASADAEGGVDGTLEDPATLEDAIDQAGNDGIVVALSRGGNYSEDGVDLSDGQTLIGGGGTLQARVGSTAGVLASSAIPDTDSTIIDPDGGSDYVIGLANDNTVSDIWIQNAYNDGIVGYAGTTGLGDGFAGGNVYIQNVTVINSDGDTDGFGLWIEGNGDNNVVIEGSDFNNNYSCNIEIGSVNNVTISDTNASESQDYNGMDIASVSGDITLTNNTVNNNNGYGMAISDAAGDITLTDDIVNENATNGIFIERFDGKVTITGTDASDNNQSNDGASNLYIDTDGGDVAGQDIIIASSTFNLNEFDRGVFIQDVNSVKFTDVTSSDNGDTNIEINGVSGLNSEGNAVSLHSVVANDSGGRGLSIDNTNGGAVLIDNLGSGGGSKFNNNGSENISINQEEGGDYGNLTINNTEAQNAGTDGIYVGGVDVITMNNSTVLSNGDNDLQFNDSYNSAFIMGRGNVWENDDIIE